MAATFLLPLTSFHLFFILSAATNSVADAEVVRFNSVVRRDGIIHALVPKSFELEFNNRRNLKSIAAVKPEASPEFESEANSALAPAPGHGGGFDGEKQVNDFIQAMLNYGGYNEMAEIMANLTNIASEIGELIDKGNALTVLAPSDEAMSKLTGEELEAAEEIVYYHIVAEYQTEESMYSAVRRFGTVSYGTLRVPHKVVAKEADGSVKFGEGENSGHLFDPDIYTDGRVSVQGIDGVLFPPPPEEEKKKNTAE